MASNRAGRREGDREHAVAGDVPAAVPRPEESEAEAAERIARHAGQDAWSEPEDRPDHAGNEVYVQRDRDGSG